MRLRNTKIVCMSLFCSLLIGTLSGCGQENPTEQKDIQLINPVNSFSNVEEAAYRNLYNVQTYSAAVFPKIQELSFSKDASFESYLAYPGESVEPGQGLAGGDTKELDKQIEELEETLREMEKDFVQYQLDIEEEMAGPRRELENIKKSTQETDSYFWKLAQKINRADIDLIQKTELYNLDYSFYHGKKEDLLKEKEELRIKAHAQGEVVALGTYEYGSNMKQDQPVIGVSDGSELLLKCQYINKSVINKAQKIYALMNGKVIDVEYQPIDPEDYNRQSAEGETIYSSFLITEKEEDVKMGDFGVIVIVEEERKEALSIPKAAIHKDGAGYYTYLLKEGQTQYTPLEIGMSDGTYTEILEGITQGDSVVLTENNYYGSKKVTVKKGDFSSEYQGEGYMIYPDRTQISNPIVYGTAYFLEFHVSLYEKVKKGDVLATIRVEEDTVELERLKLRQQRLVDRIADNEALGSDGNKKEKRSMEEEIAEIQMLIQTMETDFQTTQILAPKDGIVIWQMEAEREDLLEKEKNLLEIADESKCYIQVDNTNQLLNYGNRVTVAYTDKEGKSKTTEGMVANVSSPGVSKELQSEFSYILLPKEATPEMTATSLETGGRYYTRNRFQVTANIREMKDVLIVPKKAVTESNGTTYVNVVDESGRIKSIGFIPGGYDSSEYWVIDGLLEGMELCSE